MNANVKIKGNNNVVGDGNTVSGTGPDKGHLASNKIADIFGIKHAPKIQVTSDQRIWLKEVWRSIRETGVKPSYKAVKLTTIDRVGADFIAHDINQRLVYGNPTEITLLGVLYVSQDASVLDDIDRVVLEIKKELFSPEETEDFQFSDIAKKVALEKSYAQTIFALAVVYGNFYNSSSTSPDVANQFGFEKFSININRNPHTLDFYLKFTGIRKTLDEFFIREEERDKKSIKYKSSGIITSSLVGIPSYVANNEYFVDPARLEELENLTNTNFDFKRLIRICEELNHNYTSECYFPVPLLLRSILDHVPPLFNKKTFSEVAGNYGNRSFGESMVHLEKSSRKIADSFLHSQIRESEVLPTRTQVNFSNDLDVLLAEIIRINI